MSWFESVPQNPELLDRDKFSVIVSIADYVRFNDGEIDEYFHQYYGNLTLCANRDDLTVCPPIIAVGSNASTRQVFGHKWAEGIIQNPATPDPLLEKEAAVAYEKSRDELLACELCNAAVTCDDGLRSMTFMRLVAQFRTPVRSRKLFGFAGVVLENRLLN